jgi:hypothetical protein
MTHEHNTPSDSWDDLFAAYIARKSEAETFHARFVAPLDRAHRQTEKGTPERADAFAAYGVQQEIYDQHNSLASDALEALLAAPAPDFEEVVKKLQIGLEEGAQHCSDMAGSLITATLADIRRLMSEQAIRETGTDLSASLQWNMTLHEYEAKRLASAALPDDDQTVDKAVDAYCEAQDRLFLLPAPSFADVIKKMQMARARFDGFQLPDDVGEAIEADIRRLSTGRE